MTHNMQKLTLLLVFTLCAAMTPLAMAKKPVVGVVTPDIAFSEPLEGVQCESNQNGRTVVVSKAECRKTVALGFAKMLETAIVQTNKMSVIERAQLDPILAEQGLGEIGVTNRGGKIGGIEGLSYIVNGSITKFGTQTKGTSVSGEVGSLFGGGRGQSLLGQGISSATQTAEMGVDIKIVNVSTGEIVIADSVQMTVQAGSHIKIAGITSGESSANPISDVQRILARDIATRIVTHHFPIRVISVKEGVATLNYNNAVLSAEQCLTAYSLGEELIDPDTEESLGYEETEQGKLKVTETNTRTSKAKGVGDFAPQKGMVVRPTPCPKKG